MFKIKKVKFENYKIFRTLEVEIHDKINIFIGDNGTGKSSILQGIELALSGSISKAQTVGIGNLINIGAVNDCLEKKDINVLPKMVIEVYLEADIEEPKNEFYYGEHNSDCVNTYGVKLVCEPDNEFMSDIESCIRVDRSVFPFELYKISYRTFKGERFNGYKKPLKTCFIDSSEMNERYALKNTVKDVYLSSVDDTQRVKNRQDYKNLIAGFVFNGTAADAGICISSALEDNLSISCSGVLLENMGKGEMSIIKAEYAFKQAHSGPSIVFLEEPENHLTHSRMRKMIHDIIDKSDTKQIFIATHSSQIISRLGLRNVFFIGRGTSNCSLANLNIETSNFFQKAPSDNLLQFILSPKVILVEGAAEYILIEQFYKTQTTRIPEQDGVWIISVNGLSFKRYLEIARLIGNKVAVIRDNDKSDKKRYEEYCSDCVKVFSDPDVNRYTLEVCVYQDNKDLCESIITHRPVEDWMLKNKTDAAFAILNAAFDNIVVPSYIKDAIEWIMK